MREKLFLLLPQEESLVNLPQGFFIDMTNLDKDQIKKILYQSIDSVNKSLIDDKKIPFDLSIKIFGSHSQIDSLSFINLIAGVEEALFDFHDTQINLFDSISDVDKSFETLDDLLGLIEGLIHS